MSNKTVYQRIMGAAKEGKGLRLSLVEIQLLSLLPVIRDLARGDDEAERAVAQIEAARGKIKDE